ncbi:MAG: hypothetical protein E6662_10700, partial [Pantoea sp.]|nr:hypothetical protein [Pantoea sp.]
DAGNGDADYGVAGAWHLTDGNYPEALRFRTDKPAVLSVEPDVSAQMLMVDIIDKLHVCCN